MSRHAAIPPTSDGPEQRHAEPLPVSPDSYCTTCCPEAGRLSTGEQLAWHADADSVRDRRRGVVRLTLLAVGAVLALGAYVYVVFVWPVVSP